MSGNSRDEFEAQLRRQSSAGPPAGLRTRVLARAAATSGDAAGGAQGRARAAGRSSAKPWLAAAAAVVAVVGAVVVNAGIEGGGPAPAAAQPVMVAIPALGPGAAPLVMMLPRGNPPVTEAALLEQHRQLEALIRS